MTDDGTTALTLPGTAKMLRESLCAAEVALGLLPDGGGPRASEHRQRIQRIIDEIDSQYPPGGDRQPPQWCRSPHETLAHFLSLPFEEQTALAYAASWLQKAAQQRGRELVAELQKRPWATGATHHG